jgi:hypothetical protein
MELRRQVVLETGSFRGRGTAANQMPSCNAASGRPGPWQFLAYWIIAAGQQD